MLKTQNELAHQSVGIALDLAEKTLPLVQYTGILLHSAQEQANAKPSQEDYDPNLDRVLELARDLDTKAHELVTALGNLIHGTGH